MRMPSGGKQPDDGGHGVGEESVAECAGTGCQQGIEIVLGVDVGFGAA
jgi:hypothetical protein